MSILYLLIPLSLILLALAVWAFFWAVDNKQFDDLEGPAYSILFDDDDPRHTGQARSSTVDAAPENTDASVETIQSPSAGPTSSVSPPSPTNAQNTDSTRLSGHD